VNDGISQNTRTAIRHPQIILTCLTLAVLVIAYYGYYAYLTDQADTLSGAIHTQDPTLFARDQFAVQTADSRIRLLMYQSMHAMKLVGIPVAGQLLTLQFLSTALMAAVAFYAIRLFRLPLPAILLAPALALFYVGAELNSGFGDNSAMWEPYFSPRQPATQLLALALLLIYARHYIWAGVALAGATYWNPSSGLAGYVLIGVVAIAIRDGDVWRRLVRTIGVAALISGPYIAWIIFDQLGHLSQDADHLLDIHLFRGEHYSYFNWRWQYKISFLLINAHMVMLIWRRTQDNGVLSRMHRFIIVVWMSIFALATFHMIGVEVLHSYTIFKTMLTYRLMPIWRFLYLLLVVESIAYHWLDDRRGGIVKWLACASTIWKDWFYLPVLCYDTFWQLRDRIKPRWLLGRGYDSIAILVFATLSICTWIAFHSMHRVDVHETIAVAVFITAIWLTVVIGRRMETRSTHQRVPAGILGIALVGLAITGVSLVTIPDSPIGRHWRVARSQIVENDLDRLSWWTGGNTPKDALFLTPPWYRPFRNIAQRATFVDYKGAIYTDVELPLWYMRYTSLYAMQNNDEQSDPTRLTVRSIDQAYMNAPATDIAKLARQSDIDYFIGRSYPMYPFPVVRREGSWTLYKLPDGDL
jgi:hypothetical protein